MDMLQYYEISWVFLRALWSTDILKIKFGLASEVFLIVSTFIIVSANLILAQRLFTWRHPVGGSRKLFWGFMFATYGMVLVVIAITILASFVPYLYYLSEKSYLSWVKNCSIYFSFNFGILFDVGGIDWFVVLATHQER